MIDLSALEEAMLPLTKKHAPLQVLKDLVQSLIYIATSDKDEDYLRIGAFHYLKEKYPLNEEFFLFCPAQHSIKQLAYINRHSLDGNDILGEYYSNLFDRKSIIKTSIPLKTFEVPKNLLEFQFPQSTFILDTACSSGRLLTAFAKKFTGNYQVFYGVESNLLFAQIAALNLMFNNIIGEILCVQDGKFIASYSIDLCPYGIYQYDDETKENSVLWNLYQKVLIEEFKQSHQTLFLKPQ